MGGCVGTEQPNKKHNEQAVPVQRVEARVAPPTTQTYNVAEPSKQVETEWNPPASIPQDSIKPIKRTKV